MSAPFYLSGEIVETVDPEAARAHIFWLGHEAMFGNQVTAWKKSRFQDV